MTNTTIILAKGNHEYDGSADCPRCLFEAYNLIKRKKFTDSRPPGVSSALHIFGMRLNDCLDDQTRQALTRYLPNGADVLDGTHNDGHEETRGYIALDWLIRTYLLRFLELSPRLTEAAASVRALARIDSLEAAAAAGPVVRAAGDAAWDAAGDAARDAAGDAARDAAGAAALDAAWDAAWDAAGAAARDAAGAAARDAARAAARDAARAAAGAAARAAAWDAARAAAWDAAWDAARDAAGDAAGDAARDAARKVLRPTVVILQESALALYDQMIRGTWDD
jgi:hypothetical protein